jgi:gas vesicle protein
MMSSRLFDILSTRNLLCSTLSMIKENVSQINSSIKQYIASATAVQHINPRNNVSRNRKYFDEEIQSAVKANSSIIPNEYCRPKKTQSKLRE